MTTTWSQSKAQPQAISTPEAAEATQESDSPKSTSNRNMSKLKGWTLQGSLLMLWMDENASQQSNKIH